MTHAGGLWLTYVFAYTGVCCYLFELAHLELAHLELAHLVAHVIARGSAAVISLISTAFALQTSDMFFMCSDRIASCGWNLFLCGFGTFPLSTHLFLFLSAAVGTL